MFQFILGFDGMVAADGKLKMSTKIWFYRTLQYHSKQANIYIGITFYW